MLKLFVADAVAALANVASAYLNAGVEARRWGTEHASIVPYQVFTCGDGVAIAVGALNDAQWPRLIAALAGAGAATQATLRAPRFATNPQRVAARGELCALLADALRTQPAAHWLAACAAHAVPAARVNSVAEVFAEPQVAALDLVHETAPHPDGASRDDVVVVVLLQ